MSGTRSSVADKSSGEPARLAISLRLKARRAEIEQETVNRVLAIPDSGAVSDPTYAAGLRSTVGAAIDYSLELVEMGEERASSVPAALLTQARTAARHGIGLETVLRRYFAGYTLFGDYLLEESRKGGLLGDEELNRILRTYAAAFDSVLSTVSEEHSDECAKQVGSTRRRRASRVKRLLAGDLVDTSSFSYEFDHLHVAVMAIGAESTAAIRRLASSLDRQVLLVDFNEETVAAWLAGRRPFDVDEIEERLTVALPGPAVASIGEPAEGLRGWRLSHRQAAAALPVAIRFHRVVRYAEVALDAAVLQEDLLAASLHQMFVAPLEQERDGGRIALETLRAYFAAERNAASAAAVLKVSRQAVYGRLRLIEERLGRTVNSCAAELEVALRAADLGARRLPNRSTDD